MTLHGGVRTVSDDGVLMQGLSIDHAQPQKLLGITKASSAVGRDKQLLRRAFSTGLPYMEPATVTTTVEKPVCREPGRLKC